MFNQSPKNQSINPQDSKFQDSAFASEEQASANTKNFDNKKDFKVEDVPIYTMKKDLENPDSIQGGGEDIIVKTKKANFSDKSLTDRQKTSPFLSPEASSVSNFDSKTSPAPQKTSPLSPDFQASYGKAPENLPTESKKSNWGRVFMSAIVIIIILAAGTGGYYFWLTQKSAVEPTEVTEDPKISEPTPEPTITEPTPEIEVADPKKPGYFILDTQNLNKDQFKTAVDKHFSQISPTETNIPKEFVVVDLQNNPIGFKDFITNLKTTLPASVLADLGDDFSLFLFNEEGTPKVGLAVTVKNNLTLKNNLLKEEKGLAQELSPIFLLTEYTAEKPFASSSYGGAEIRYQNLISPEKLSIDYAIFANKLLIGTTRLTLRSMIDYLSVEYTK